MKAKDILNMPEKMQEVLNRITYYYSKTNGTNEYPNSREGDLISLMYKAIMQLLNTEVDEDKLRELGYVKAPICPICNGQGWTAEHDPQDPHENGCSNCPIQVQCEPCLGTGFVQEVIPKSEIKSMISLDVEKVEKAIMGLGWTSDEYQIFVPKSGIQIIAKAIAERKDEIVTVEGVE